MLDSLLVKNGQSLGELEAGLDMTRFGCMKHLKVLEAAGLVVARKMGRRTLHYLNPVPIQQVADRWISRYTQPWAAHLLDMKSSVERTMTQQQETKTNVFQVTIYAPIQKVWDALTQPEQTEKYYFGTRVDTTLAPGGPFRYLGAENAPMIEGEVLECDPPRRLKSTFKPLWPGNEEFPLTATTYELEEERPGITTLTLTHEGLPLDHATTQATWHGWNQILSGLKTFLEAPHLLG